MKSIKNKLLGIWYEVRDMHLIRHFFIAAIFCSLVGIAMAQDSIGTQSSSNSGDLKFVLTGDAFFGYKYSHSPSKGTTSTFTTMGYNPVILYKLSNKFFFEGEVEFQTSRWQEEADATSGNAAAEGLAVELEYANLNFVINKYMLLKAGIMFTPYGVFEDWYHQRITNRMTSRPPGIGHGGIEPGADEGVQINGGFSLGVAKLHYAVALLNGGKLITDDPANIGNLKYESIIDNNANKALVGRLGILPFSNSSLEFGGWIGTSKVNSNQDKLNAAVKATHSGVYLSYVKDIDQIKGSLTFRSQYSNLKVDNFIYTLESDTGINIGRKYLFKDNNSSAYYTQLSYRPRMAQNKFLKKVELNVRYGSVTLPTQAQGKWIMPATTTGAKDKTQWAYALDYWFKWNAVLKIAFEQNYPAKVNGVRPALSPGTLFLQAAFGL